MARIGKGYLKKLNNMNRTTSAVDRAYTQQIVAQHLSGVQVFKKNPGGKMNFMINETMLSMSHDWHHTSSQAVIDADTFVFGLGLVVTTNLSGSTFTDGGAICKVGISASHEYLGNDNGGAGLYDPVYFFSGSESGTDKHTTLLELRTSGSKDILFPGRGAGLDSQAGGQASGFTSSYFVTAVTTKKLAKLPGKIRLAAYYAKLRAPSS